MIRDAINSDLPALVDLAQQLVTESTSFDIESFRREKTFAFLDSLIQHPDGILLMSEIDGIITGAMAGLVAEHPFSYDKYAFDYGLFTDIRYRGRFTAARLIRVFESRAKILGAKDFRPGIMTGVHVSRTTKLYERLGYKQTGTQLIKVW